MSLYKPLILPKAVVSETFHLLCCSCPAANCTSDARKDTSWYHNNCGGALEISDHGNIRCTFHPTVHNYPMTNWSFACGSHPGEYREADFEGYSTAFCFASNMMKKAGAQWSSRLIAKLGQIYDCN